MADELEAVAAPDEAEEYVSPVDDPNFVDPNDQPLEWNQGDANAPKRKGGWQRKIERLEAELRQFRNGSANDADETFREYTKRREDETSGKAAERKALAKEITAAQASRELETLKHEIAEGGDTADGYDDSGELAPLQPASAEDFDRIVSERAEDLMVMREYESQVNATVQRHPDMMQLVQRSIDEGIKFPPALDLVLTHLPNAGEVSYELLKDLNLTRKLSNMPFERASAELAKLSARVGGNGSPAPSVSSAPPPISPVRRPGSVSEKKPEDMDFKEYTAYREKQIAAKNRR